MAFLYPYAALFFHHSTNKLIVACGDGIFIIDVSAQSVQPFSSTPQSAYYCPHSITLADDDFVLVVGCYSSPYIVCGYNTTSRTRLWIYNTVDNVGAVCMLGDYVIVTVCENPILVLGRISGALIVALQKAEGLIFGQGVIEGLCFISS